MPVIFALIGGAIFYKVGQVLFDEVYPGTAVPEKVRKEMLEEHVRKLGWFCLRCGKRSHDLQVDHIIPISKDGSNSRYNLQILCAECNQSKGNDYTIWEGFTGRSK